MSTKVTIEHGKEFHFYKECFDDDNVFLQLSGRTLDFEAYPNSVMVKIPLEVWNKIVKAGVLVHPKQDMGDETWKKPCPTEIDCKCKGKKRKKQSKGEIE